jgi:L-threonylcarbamoyladenylate synthase
LAIPTESSWGLAVDPRDARGVEAIFSLKGRHEASPLPVVAADRSQILALGVDPTDPGLTLGEPHWPAALSVVVQLQAPLPASRGRRDLAVRIPAHEGLRRLLAGLGTALTATSANLSGTPPILAQSDLAVLFAGREGAIVGGGVLPGGPPSTLIGFESGSPVVLRPGRYEWPSADAGPTSKPRQP